MIKPNSIGNALQGLLIALLGSVVVWLILGQPETGIDDADIFFVYARHFAEGHGFVYNIGGERVEGFTSMLWTVICSCFSFFFHSIEKPVYLLNLLIGAATVFVCLRRVRHPGLFLALLASSPAWFAWCQVALMETGLWCLLITLLGLAVFEQRIRLVCVLLPLLVLTRPESMLWGLWAVLLVFMQAEKGGRFRTAWLPALVFVSSLSILIAFRVWYFGYPFPNTYYAKVSPDFLANLSDGFGYLSGYVFGSAGVLVGIVFWLFAFWRGNGRREFMLAVFLLPGIGIPVLVGGDHFGGFRFYQPIWPLLCLLVVQQWPLLMERINPRLVRLVLTGIVVSGWLAFPITANLKHEFRIAKEGRLTGATLTQMFGDLDTWPTVATITAGGNKLGYSGPVYDLMGLNSTSMAQAPGEGVAFKNHTGFNRAVFYRWQPDILLCGDSHTFDSMVLNGLHDEPRFSAQYVKCTLYRNGTELAAYYSNTFLMGIPEAADH